MKMHLEWLPNYINLTLVCDCPEGSSQPVLLPNVLPGQENASSSQPWSTVQLVHAVRNKIAVIYGCHDHGNDTVSEGFITVGRTLRNYEEYTNLYLSTLRASFWPYHKHLLASTQRYMMNHNKPLGCNFRHQFYLDRGLTKSDIALIVVVGIMAIMLILSLCARLSCIHMRVICKLV
uniref:Uncharacterized protein n=1 Tax=Anopheles maculatus TaxID=74869 RepID=A0A182SCB8_9DIPT